MSNKVKATAVASMALVANAATNATMNSQIRLAYHGDSGIMVSWNTFQQVDQPTVRWGLSADNLNETASSNVSVTYLTSLTFNNHVLIEGLKPFTTYHYLPDQLLNGNGATPFNFTTSRSAGDKTPYSVALVADLGTMGDQGLTTTAGKGVDKNNILKKGEINTIQSLASFIDSYDFLWHDGDIAYADYWLKEEIQGFLPNVTVDDGVKLYESILNDFYDEMMSVTARKPYMVGVGNHEANCDNGGTKDKAKNITYTDSICVQGQTNFTGYKNHFRMPSDISNGTDNFWFSFDVGMTHYIQLDSETDLGAGIIGADEIGGADGEGASPVNANPNAQTAWLEADLAAVDRNKTPWVIAALHRPIYLSLEDSGTLCADCQRVFEPLFVKYGVDMIFSGHAHVYERQAPIANGQIDPNELNNPQSPWYITNGAAGHYDGLDELDSTRKAFSRFVLDTNNATYGWSRLTFHNCTHMTHDFIASNNGTVLDSATLYKARTCNDSGNSTSGSGEGTSPGSGNSPSGSGEGTSPGSGNSPSPGSGNSPSSGSGGSSPSPGSGNSPSSGSGNSPSSGSGEGTSPGSGASPSSGSGEGSSPASGGSPSSGSGASPSSGSGEGSSPASGGSPSSGSGASPSSGSGNSPSSGSGEGTSPGSGASPSSGSGEGTSPGSGASPSSGSGEGSSPASGGSPSSGSGASPSSGSGGSPSSGSGPGNSSTTVVPAPSTAAGVSYGALQVIAVAALTTVFGLLM